MDPAEDHEQCGPNRPTAESSCNNALLTGHKTRAIFDRYNIINEQELLEAGDQLVAYLAQHAQATPRGGRPHPARTAAARTAPPLRLVRRTTA